MTPPRRLVAVGAIVLLSSGAATNAHALSTRGRAALRALDRKCPENQAALLVDAANARRRLQHRHVHHSVDHIIRAVNRGVTSVRTDTCQYDFNAYVYIQTH